jgi:hypothetical protein
MVPCSTQVNIWKKRINQMRNKNRVIIVNTTKGSVVLIFQNMFPITKKYVDKEYSGLKLFYSINKKRLDKIANNMTTILKKGIKLSKYPPDVPRIYNLMLKELKNTKAKVNIPDLAQISTHREEQKQTKAQISTNNNSLHM